MYSVSSCVYSVSSYLYSVKLYIFSLTCMYSVSSYFYLVRWYVLSLFLLLFSLILYIPNHLLNTCPITCYMFQFTFMFCKHVQCAVRHVENLIKTCSFLKKKTEEMNACRAIISYNEIKQTKLLSRRKIFILIVMP